jgi:hypothetical protein
MNAPASIFLEFNLPNATTWFYFSFLLAVALFFKFSRLLSIRNLDVVTIFLLVPGLLLLQEARGRAATAGEVAQAAALVGDAGLAAAGASQTGLAGLGRFSGAMVTPTGTSTALWLGYVWLLAGSIYLLLRCGLDLVLVRRPALAPNLNSGGLAWLAGAMFISLAAVAFRPVPVAAPVGSEESTVEATVRANSSTSRAPTPETPDTRETVGQPSAMVTLAQDQFESLVVLKRSFAILCHLMVVVGLVLVARLHFQDITAGMAAATFYLLLPYTGYFVGQVHHVLPMVFVVWALVCYRWPTLAGVLLGLAVGTTFFPVLIVPLWISFYWRRGAGRFTVACVLVALACVVITLLILWWYGDLERALAHTLALPDWQPWHWRAPSHEGFWTGFHWAYRTPVFILYAALVAVTAFWPYPKNLAHVLALSAAVLIGLQLWYADQGGVYVLWYLPLVLLMIFRPNLADRRPPPLVPEHDWPTALWGQIKKMFRWVWRVPDTLLHARGGRVMK